jgi:hypothetical protein
MGMPHIVLDSVSFTPVLVFSCCLQVAALSNLRSLTVSGVMYSGDSMASLTRLTSLRHAKFDTCELPDSLPELTGLQVLQICGLDLLSEDVVASLDSTLPQICQLTQLTGLWLEGMPTVFVVPQSLATLSRLQWLVIDRCTTEEEEAEPWWGPPWEKPP